MTATNPFNQGRGLYPRVRDYHNTHGASVVFRTDTEIPIGRLDGLMVVVRSDLAREFDGPHLTRKQIGSAVEEMKQEWGKWNKHINAVVVTAYDDETDKSAVMLGILTPAEHASLFSDNDRYEFMTFGTPPVEREEADPARVEPEYEEVV